MQLLWVRVQIFNRKQEDIKKCGYTLWICNSSACKGPQHIQRFCQQENVQYFVIVESSTSARRANKILQSTQPHNVGVSQTTTIDSVNEWSRLSSSKWYTLPNDLSPVTVKTHVHLSLTILNYIFNEMANQCISIYTTMKLFNRMVNVKTLYHNKECQRGHCVNVHIKILNAERQFVE